MPSRWSASRGVIGTGRPVNPVLFSEAVAIELDVFGEGSSYDCSPGVGIHVLIVDLEASIGMSEIQVRQRGSALDLSEVLV